MLDEIENEAIPERLLMLAAKLQSALTEQRAKEVEPNVQAPSDA